MSSFGVNQIKATLIYFLNYYIVCEEWTGNKERNDELSVIQVKDNCGLN